MPDTPTTAEQRTRHERDRAFFAAQERLRRAKVELQSAEDAVWQLLRE